MRPLALAPQLKRDPLGSPHECPEVRLGLDNMIQNPWAGGLWLVTGAGFAMWFRSKVSQARQDELRTPGAAPSSDDDRRRPRLVPLAFGLGFIWLLLFAVLDWIF